MKTFENVEWIKPPKTFRQIIVSKGYPLFSKEISETIWWARKITGGGRYYKSQEYFRPRILGKKRNTNEKNLCATELSEKETTRVFLDGQEEGNKSIFNKLKYLPACRELPFLISGFCCNEMKKSPMKKYQTKTGKKPFVGTTTEESLLRMQGWLKTGCNAYNSGVSKPLSFWTEQDILRYIKENKIKIADIYGEIITIGNDGLQYENALCDCGKLKCSGCQRTGCMYCAFGAQNEHKRLGKSRYELLAEKHPEVYDFCMRGGEWVDNPYYDATAPKIEKDGWVNWNPEKIWQPSATGLGLKFVFNEVNKIYGRDFIKYE